MQNQKVMVTGSMGYIGGHLCNELTYRGWSVVGVSRSAKQNKNCIENHVVDLMDDLPTSAAFNSCDVVIHCAARAHHINDANSKLDLYSRVNTDATLRLAEEAAAHGVRRFIYLSTIGVHSGYFNRKIVINEATPMCADEAYAVSKIAAEKGLWKIAKRTGIELVIIRPCLVAGYGAPGNLLRLKRILKAGWPIPVPWKDNKKSFVSLGNLIDLIAICIKHKSAANNVFIAADREPVSTVEIMSAICVGMKKGLHILRIPNSLLYMGARLVGKQSIYKKLYGCHVADSSKAIKLLGWIPKQSTLESMELVGQYVDTE